MHITKKTSILCLLSAVVLFGWGYAAASARFNRHTETGRQFPLLAKRLFVENPNDPRINFSGLRTSLNQYFADQKIEGSLYFEYLPTGSSLRVNPDVRYHAASLIKLPVAMELYKARELGKLTLDQEVSLKEEWLNDSYGSLYKKGAGYRLSLKEAAEIMLKESDNTALRVVLDANDKVLDTKNRALGSLDIEFSSDTDGSLDMGTRAYASFLKCLYFSCYNTQHDSQTILELLTKTPFDNRIVAGIDDKDVIVAHKIGVFNTQVQSDCGIVYVPQRNYVLCIMLAGDDNASTNTTMAHISKMVYTFVKD